MTLRANIQDLEDNGVKGDWAFDKDASHILPLGTGGYGWSEGMAEEEEKDDQPEEESEVT